MTIKSYISSNITDCDQFDIELIISHVINKDRVFTITHNTQILTKKQVNDITLLCQKRSTGYPLAYILGEKEFYGRTFAVTENTLIPRPETELMIDCVLSLITKEQLSNVLIIDIGTGSGIIPITLSKEISSTISKQIIATDISPEALQIAKSNAQKHNLNDITFFTADLLTDIQLLNFIKNTNHAHILITANLPYVNNKIKEDLLTKKESKALKYEPQIALWSDDYGLAHYKQLLSQTIDLSNTKKQITSFYEISPEQYKPLKNYLKTKLQSPNTKVFNDLANKERIVQFSNNV